MRSVTASRITASSVRRAELWRPAPATAVTFATVQGNAHPTSRPRVRPAGLVVQAPVTTPTAATARVAATPVRRRPLSPAAMPHRPAMWRSSATARAVALPTDLRLPELRVGMAPRAPVPHPTVAMERAAATRATQPMARSAARLPRPSGATASAVARGLSNRLRRRSAQADRARLPWPPGATSRCAAPTHPARWTERRPTATDAMLRRPRAATETVP